MTEEPAPGSDASKTRYGRAIRWAFVMNFGQQIILTVLTFVVASMVGEESVGLAGMAVTFVMFIKLLLEQGLTAALIQRKDLREEHVDSVFWLVMLMCVALTGLCALASDFWARVNEEPELAKVILVLSLSIPIEGLSIVQQAMLQRAMEFKKLALRSNVSALVGGLTGLTLAFLGYSVWAIVVQQLTRAAVGLVLLWGTSSWRPKWRFSWPHARELLGFSAGTFVGKVGIFVGNHSDVLLMGLFYDKGAIGIYYLAVRVVRLTLDVVTRSLQVVALPQFSKLQEDPRALRESLVTSTGWSCTLTIPAMVWVACLSGPFMALVGPRWAEGANALRILCALGAASSLTVFVGPLLQAKGRPRRLAALIWAHGGMCAFMFVATGYLFRDAIMPHQIASIATAKAFVTGLVFGPINAWVMSRLAGIPLGELLRPARSAFVASIGIVAVAFVLLGSGWLPEAPVWRLVLGGIPAAAVGGGLLLGLDPNLRRMVGQRVGKLRGSSHA